MTTCYRCHNEVSIEYMMVFMPDPSIDLLGEERNFCKSCSDYIWDLYESAESKANA